MQTVGNKKKGYINRLFAGGSCGFVTLLNNVISTLNIKFEINQKTILKELNKLNYFLLYRKKNFSEIHPT